MAPENKELLLRYLCMALPYGVKCVLSEYHIEEFPYNGTYCDKVLNLGINGSTINLLNHIEKYGVKPYLRPMSSMSDEEEEEYNRLNVYEAGLFPHTEEAFNWLLENHFDFMGLISKDLAIEVTEENNPYV